MTSFDHGVPFRVIWCLTSTGVGAEGSFLDYECKAKKSEFATEGLNTL